MKNKVKLFTRSTDSNRRRVGATRKAYPVGTKFYLRWLPRKAINYRYESLGAVTYSTAQVQRAQKELELAKEQELASPAPSEGVPLTLEEFRAAFVHDKETTFKKDGTPLNPETIHTYEFVTREFLDIIKCTQPKQITKKHVRDWIAVQRKKVSHRTVCNLYILVACYLKFCGIDHKELLPQAERPKPVIVTPVTYSHDEMTRFFFNVMVERDALAFEFLLKTGARKREMTFLDWENNLNLGPNPTVKFFTKDGFRVKTGKFRIVPLEKELAANLRAWRTKNPTTYLVFGMKDDRPEGNFLRIGKDVAERSGMKRSKFKLHRLRDTFATWALRRGVDIRTVQHWLGHATISMTQKYLAPEEGEAAQNQINQAFGATVRGFRAGA